MNVQPYLFFEGRCEEAIDFYKQALGAKVEMLMRYSDSPEPPPPGCMPAGMEHKVMHSCFNIGDTAVMASDGMCSGKSEFGGFSLSVSATDEADFERKFNALAVGGAVMMPPGKTFFSPRFGITRDRFGVSWMVIIPQ